MSPYISLYLPISPYISPKQARFREQQQQQRLLAKHRLPSAYGVRDEANPPPPAHIAHAAALQTARVTVR